MKKKIILDIIMTAIFLCLLNTNFTGVALHEILGIAVFFLFLLHKIFNFKWIKSITANLFKKSLKAKPKIMYLIDVILLILVTLNVATGILISTTVLTGISANNILLTSNLHHILAYSLLAVLIVHIALHLAVIRNAMKLKKHSAISYVALVAVISLMVVTLFESNTIKNAIMQKKEINSHYESGTEEKPKEDNTSSDTLSQNSSTTSQNTSSNPSSNDTSDKNNESDDDHNSENSSQNSSQNISSTVAEDRPTIEEYLSKLFCSGCGRRCPLTNLACGKGNRYQQQKVDQYNRIYGTNETYSSQNDRWR